MKKIFTILAAALFSVSMMADVSTEVFDQTGASNGNAMVKTSATLAGTYIAGQGGGKIQAYTPDNKGVKLNVKTTTYKIESTTYGYVVLNVNSGYKVKGVKLEGTSNSSNNVVLLGVYADVNTEDLATAIPAATNQLGATATTFPNKTTDFVTSPSLTFDAVKNVVFVFDNGSDSQMRAIFTVSYELIPATNPVQTVTIAGETACFVGRKITLTATTDVNADEYKWAVNGVDQAESNSKSFEYTPAAAGEYTFVCYAKNANNADWVASAAHKVEATVKEVLTQVDVTETTVWDWTKASAKSSIEFDANTVPARDAEVLLANVDDINNDANFNSQALLFAGQYPIRDGKYCQGGLLKFHTTVPGTVQVEFSNTGTSDRPNRYVAVNGVVNTTVGSKDKDKVTSAEIAVAAGDVKIEGSFEEYNAEAPQYLIIYKLTFTKSEGTAVDNINVSEKTVKMIENGQLIIIKNGVKFNAQGVAL